MKSAIAKPTRIVIGLALAALLAGAIVVPSVAGTSRQASAFQATDTPAPTVAPEPTTEPTHTPLPSTTPTSAAPTLVPPTPMPEVVPDEVELVAVSGLEGIQRDRVLRVGTFFNEFPFAWLSDTGEVTGYEADILRSIGIELGIAIDFVQVTRNNALESLLTGRVDALIGQQILADDRFESVDFTHPYYLNSERMVVRQDSPYGDLAQLAGQPVGVEISTRSERALRQVGEQRGIAFDIRTYFSESDALDALANGEVEGMVGELDSLRRAGRQQMRLIDEPVMTEPYAIAVRRWDVNLRNLLNRSLQRLKASGRLDEIFDAWFPDDSIDFDILVPVYDALYADERGIDQFNADVPLPANPVMDRVASGQPIRVAGILETENSEAPAQIRITNALNRAIVEELARRWDAQIEFVPDSAHNAVDLVANGQADLAVGVSPRWDGADRVDYSVPYIEHGDRLMVPERSQVETFADMLGTGWWIGYFADDAADEENIRKMAEHFNVAQNVQTFAIQRESDAIYTMTVEDNIRAIYGDSLRLLALMRQSEDPGVKMLDTWYGDVLPIAFAVPRNDADFRHLIDITLQDMAVDGTYQSFWSTHFGLGDPLTILNWPEVSPGKQS
ncbi:MAG: transporter substrate-binding domain-containing protein [Chloroflexi bacterium]|nr:transporter substrate-binding domain-containing protein [Chloroflexota bacterium]